MLQGEWKKLVCEDLILPSFKISKLEAVGRRLKRNYVFIFILIMVAWVTKIFLHATEPIDSVRVVLSRAARRSYSVLAGGVHFCRHLRHRDRHHDLCRQENLRRNLGIRHASLALADMSSAI